jgi:adenosylhomocysteinase
MEPADVGAQRIEWTKENMRLLAGIRQRFEVEQPFTGLTIGVSIHLEPKTAVLLQTLRTGGADLFATGNLGTTQDDVVASLNREGIRAIGRRADTPEEHLGNVARIAGSGLDLVLDNGADIIAAADDQRIIGATEETTSGGNRLRSELAERVGYPVIVINDSPLKAIVENQHSVGQSVVESLQRITNLMPQAWHLAVFGYGWCGRGIAHYARQVGASVMVVEPDEIKALEAAMFGFPVRSVEEAIESAGVIVTATGAERVITADHIDLFQPDAILANAGHFDVEIDVPSLAAAAESRVEIAPGIERLDFGDGRSIRLLTLGRMFNLGGVSAKGNSIESMDLGFSLQALSLERLALDRSALVPGAQPVPDDINRLLARQFVELIGG